MRGRNKVLLAAMLAATMLVGCNDPLATTSDYSGDYDGTTYEQSYDNDVIREEDMAGDATDLRADAKAEGDGQDATDPQFDNSKIVRTVRATVSSRDFDAASAKADELVSAHKALVTADDYDADEDLSYRTRDMTLRVASDQVDSLVSEIKSTDAWVVEDLSVSASDMSASYHDNETRIKTLRERYDFYEKKAQEATDEQVMVEMTDRMLQTLDQIELLESQNRQTDVDVAWSTVSLTIRHDTGAQSLDTSDDVGQTLIDSLTVLPSNIAAAFGRFLILIVVLIPYLLVIGLIVLVVVVCVRAYHKRHPKSERPEPKPRPERPSRRDRRQGPKADRKPAGNFATHADGDDAPTTENPDGTEDVTPEGDVPAAGE